MHNYRKPNVKWQKYLLPRGADIVILLLNFISDIFYNKMDKKTITSNNKRLQQKR